MTNKRINFMNELTFGDNIKMEQFPKDCVMRISKRMLHKIMAKGAIQVHFIPGAYDLVSGRDCSGIYIVPRDSFYEIRYIVLYRKIYKFSERKKVYFL